VAIELRKTGISVVGDMPWGAHFCYFYETKQDLFDILAPYFKVGLENNEFCLWLISKSELLTIQEATSALRKALPDLGRYLAEGSIEVVYNDEWFLNGGALDIHRVANQFKKKLDEALVRGYIGMRINGSPVWLQRKGRKKLRQLEEELDKLFFNERIIASCTYPLGRSGANFLLDATRNHKFAIARRHGNWEVLKTPELIQAKREITRLHEELEQRVIDRTRELAATNEELRREIIERKRDEEALKESQRKFEEAQRIAHVGHWERDLETGLITWSDETYRIFGLPLRGHDLPLMKWQDMLHPEDRERVSTTVEEAKRGIHRYDFEYRLVRPDGEVRFIQCQGDNICDEQGRPRLAFGIAQDITDRKLVEEQLRQSESQLAEAQRLAHIGSWNWDVRGSIVTWSDEIYRIFGVDRQAFKPAYEDTIMELIHPEDRASLRDAVERSLKTQRPSSFYYRLLRHNGEERVVHSRWEVISDEDGNPIRMFGTAQDVTERKLAEERLREYEKVVEGLEEMIVVVDQDYRYLIANRSFLSYRNMEREEVVGHLIPEVLNKRVFENVIKQKLDECFQGKVVRYESTYRYPERGERNLLLSYFPIEGPGGVNRAACIIQDITERKLAEQKLRATTEQLRALSARLQSAREEEGTRIAREIHDELGAALTSLKWDLESFDKVISESGDQAQLHVLRERIEAMLRLTETTISTVRRISSELRPSVLDDLGLVEAIEWRAQQFQARTGIICRCDCSLDDLNFSREQSTAVFHILQEALTNILRHAQATRVDIKMKAEAGEFVLTISDDGKGITEDEKSRSESLGLLGMQERAHLIGGKINIAGVEGKGTVVSVRVPNSG
jgi:PAS domain S-box-containing protein